MKREENGKRKYFISLAKDIININLLYYRYNILLSIYYIIIILILFIDIIDINFMFCIKYAK